MKTELAKSKKTDLVDRAKKLKIAGASALKKDDLITAIIKAEKTKAKAKSTPARGVKKTVRAKATTAKKTAKKIAKKIATQSGAKTSVKKKVVRKKVARKKTVKSAKSADVVVSPPSQQSYAPNTHGSETKTIRYATSDLPATYHETKIVAIVRDPYWAFTYWDLSEDSMSYMRSVHEEYEGVRPVLRIHDVTGLSFNGSNGNRNWDVDVSIDAKSWYINLGSPGASFVFDLGLKDKTGRFFLLARSNTIALPTDYPSQVIDEKWMISDVDFDELYALSGGFGVGLSSAELKKRPQPRPFGMHELLSSGGLGSQNVAPEEEKEKTFFLEVATELILYGRTHADAHLTVDSKKIKLRPDGTFSLRFFLPDGSLRLPVKAVSADKDDERSVKIKVDKETR